MVLCVSWSIILKVLILVAFDVSTSANSQQQQRYDVCIIGAGPGGLQVANFLQHRKRNYIVLDRESSAGSFFQKYPTNRRLISINKIFTDRGHTPEADYDYNYRYDWNSLLDPDPSLRFREFSQEFYPHADTMVEYLKSFAQKRNLNIRYNANVTLIDYVEGIDRTDTAAHRLQISIHHDDYPTRCRSVVVATGKSIPNIPDEMGGLRQHAIQYGDAPIDPAAYRNKTILLLGCGNSAMEVADIASRHAATVRAQCRSGVRLALQTHYVGDVRAINNLLLETYQLKVGDGINTDRFDGRLLVPLPSGRKILLTHHLHDNRTADVNNPQSILTHHDVRHVLRYHGEVVHGPVADAWVNATYERLQIFPNPRFTLVYSTLVQAHRAPYDYVICATGFRMDRSIMKQGTTMPKNGARSGALPKTTPLFEGQETPGVFYAGTLMHDRDHRRSSGSFIHGFRYLCRVLFHHLEQTMYRKVWPSIDIDRDIKELTYSIGERLVVTSALFQMFGVLSDVYTLSCGNGPFRRWYEIPQDAISDVNFGEHAGPVIVISLEFHPNYTVAGGDVFRQGREAQPNPIPGIGEGPSASLFVHPIVRVYRNTGEASNVDNAVLEHHMIEEFTNDWDHYVMHRPNLHRFLKTAAIPFMVAHAQGGQGDGVHHGGGCMEPLADLHEMNPPLQPWPFTREEQMRHPIIRETLVWAEQGRHTREEHRMLAKEIIEQDCQRDGLTRKWTDALMEAEHKWGPFPSLPITVPEGGILPKSFKRNLGWIVPELQQEQRQLQQQQRPMRGHSQSTLEL